MLLVAVAAAPVLAGCQARDGAQHAIGRAEPADSTGGTDLSAAASGLCLAIAALPDGQAAERAFDNSAHEALHALAAAPGLERDLAAHVLESMERVEADFAGPADEKGLAADLHDLATHTDEALTALGKSAAPCT
jgi:hypothetical protein